MKRHAILHLVVGVIALVLMSAGCSPSAPPAVSLPTGKAQTHAPMKDERLTEAEQKALDEAVQKLKSPQADDRVAGASALIKLGTKAQGATAALLEAIKDKNAAVRCHAAKALAPIGYHSSPRAVIPALSQALKDDDTGVRRQAAESLWEIVRSVPSVADEPVAALREAALRDKDKSVRIYAARALGERDPKTVESVLRDALKDPDTEFQRHAINVLAETGEAAAAGVPLLIEAVKHKDVEVREQDLFALGRIGTIEAVAALAELLGHMHARTRVGAAQALRGLRSRAQTAVPALARALKDKERAVSATAAEALGAIGPRAKEAVPALAAALKYKESRDGWVVRVHAAKALGQIGPAAKDAVPALVQAVKFVNYPQRSFTSEDIELLAKIEAQMLGIESKPSNEANAVWRAYAIQFNLLMESRSAAAAALQAIDLEAAKALVPELIEMLKDKDVVIRYCGAGALGCLGPEARPAVPLLTEAYKNKDESSYVRTEAAGALRRIDAQAAKNAGLK